MKIDNVLINFFTKSLLLQGETNIDNITITTVFKICKGRLDRLMIIKYALINALKEQSSDNGQKVLNEIENGIKGVT